MLYRTLLVSFLGLKLSCEHQQRWPPYAQTPLARVHNHYLYKQEIENLVPPNTSSQDSLQLLERYTQNWIVKHLLAHQAELYEETHPSDIEKKVAEFRSALLVHNYLQNQIHIQLNKEVTDPEISSYYQSNQKEFKLRYNIVKGKFVVLPKNAPNIQHVKKLITSVEEADLTELQTYCAQYAKDYSLDESVWLKWDDIVTKTPFRKVPDKTRLLKKTSFTEVQDSSYRYYLKIDAYKVTGDIAPIELVREQIVDIILYKRKIDLTNQIKQDILAQAKVNHDYTIYEQKNEHTMHTAE